MNVSKIGMMLIRIECLILLKENALKR